jgi:bacterioferritin-associated ferredoxin
MIVCVCKAISASALRARIDSGARTLAELARQTGVTTDCGTCAVTILEMLEEAKNARDARPGPDPERGGAA